MSVRRSTLVETSGVGRTAKWGRHVGFVTSARRGSVFVWWLGTTFEDQMSPDEVKPFDDAALLEAAKGAWKGDGSAFQVIRERLVAHGMAAAAARCT
jgi:hypothetical protein